MNTDQENLIVPSSVRIGAPSAANAVVPVPRVESALSFRLGTMADVPAMDALQKRYKNALGYFKTQYFKGYVEMGGVLVAECDGALVGYCISRDRYLRRDELGIIYHLCVAPGEQRKLVGAALVREVFARSAYGCKLYCLWCAQDLEANYFWESMGFVPIAFRAGSAAKSRVHIFWQKRTREGDTTTPWWFPSKTSGGAMGEDRLVFPIPPGTRWSDAKPTILPGEENRVSGVGDRVSGEGKKRLPASSRNPKPETRNPARRQFALLGPPPPVNQQQPDAPAPATEPAQKPRRAPRPKLKHDPKHVAAARELRDRSLEYFNSGQFVLESVGKYDVSRALPATTRVELPDPAGASAPPLMPAIHSPKRLPRPARAA